MRYLYVSDVTGSPVVNTVSVATPGCDYGLATSTFRYNTTEKQLRNHAIKFW